MEGKWASVRKEEGCERGVRGGNEEINHTHVGNSTNECKIGKKCKSKTCKFVFSSLYVYHCLHMYTYMLTTHTYTAHTYKHIHTYIAHTYKHTHT